MTLALTLAVLLLWAGPAAADPASLIIGAAGLGANTIAASAIRVGVGLALSFIGSALAAEQGATNQGVRTEVQMDGATWPQSLILGRTATAGHVLAPHYAAGRTSDVPNGYRYRITDLADMPITGLRKVWVNGTVFKLGDTLLGSTAITGQGATPNPVGRKAWTESEDNLYVALADGTQTAADPIMLDKFGDHEERPWTSGMIGLDVAYCRTIHRYDTDVYSGEPDLLFELNGMPLYDRRLDSTAGGDGPQRLGDRATWAYSENPVTMIAHILMGITLPGGRTFGLDVDPGDMPIAEWFEAADICDEDNNGAARYTAGTEVLMGTANQRGDTPLDVIDRLLPSFSGQIADDGGTWRIRSGGPRVALYTITDDDIIIDDPRDLQPYDGITQTFNIVRAAYPDPAQRWQQTEAPPRRDDDAIVEDGEELPADLSVSTVWDGGQIQRLMAAWLKDARRTRTHTITLPPEFSDLTALDSIAWTSASNGYDAEVFEIAEVAEDPWTLAITVSLRAARAGDFDDPVTLIPVSAPSSEVVSYDDFGMPGAAAEAVTVLDADDNPARSDIRVSWFSGTTGVASVSWEVRVTATDSLAASGSTTDIRRGEAFVGGGVQPSTGYTVTIRGHDQDTEATTVTLTTPDVRIPTSTLPDQITDALDYAEDQVRNLVDVVLAGFDLDAALEDRLIGSYGPLDPAQSLSDDLAGIGADVSQSIADIERIDLGLSLSAPLVDTTEALDAIWEQIQGVLLSQAATDSRFASAGFYVDPASGRITLEAISRVDDVLGDVSLRLDAQAAEIAARATFSDLATLSVDPTYVPLLDDLTGRVTTAELLVSALDGVVSLKSDTVTVDGIDLRLTTAETGIDSLAAEIADRVETTTFDALGSRVTAAETTLGALDGASLSVLLQDTRSTGDALDASALADLESLLTAYEDREAQRVDLAYLRQDFRALVDADRESIASLRTELGVSFDGAVALVVSETIARAAADEAQAADTVALDVRLTDAETGLGGAVTATTALTGRVAQTEAGLVAEGARVDTIDASLTDATGDIAGLGQAATEIAARVAQTEDGLVVGAAERTVLTAQAGDAGDAAGAADLRAILAGHEAGEKLSSAVADARQEMTVDIVAGREATAAVRLELTAGIEGAVAAVTRESQARAAADEAVASDVLQLDARLSVAETDVVAGATATQQVEARVTATEGVVTSQSQAITALEADVADAEAGLAANAAATAALDSRVTTAESGLTSQSSALTALQNGLTAAEGDIAANAGATSSLASRVTTAESTVASQSSAITDLQNDLTDAAADIVANAGATQTLDSLVQSQGGTLTAYGQQITSLTATLTATGGSVTANIGAIQGLTSRVDITEGSITAINQAATTLEARVDDVEADVAAGATAAQALETRVTAAEGVNTSQATFLTDLNASLTTINGKANANAGAITGVQATVTEIDGDVTALASEVLALETSTGQSVAALQQVNAAQTTALGSITTRTTTLEATAGAQGARLTITEAAIAEIDGYQSATFVLRAEAGNASAGLEIVAADDPINGPASGVALRADQILFEGGVGIVGTLDLNGEAVTIPRFSKSGSSSAGTNINGTGFDNASTLNSITFTRAAHPAFFTATVQMDGASASDEPRLIFWITREIGDVSSVIDSFQVGQGAKRQTHTFTAVDEASNTGTCVYRLLCARLNDSVGSPRIFQRTLQMQQFQR